MANSVLLSKFTATKHPATVQSLRHQIHRPPAFNLRFTPRLDFSRYSLKITAVKLEPPKSSSIQFQPQPPQNQNQNQNHEADRSPISVNAILKLLKKCGSTLVIMAVLLMSCPVSAWAKAHILPWQSSSARRRRATSSSSSLPDSGSQVEAAIVLNAVNIFAFCFLFFVIFDTVRMYSKDWDRTSVLKLQVGLLDTARSLQRELIAEIPCTSTHTVESRVLTGTIRALLCHPDYCISAYTCAHVERSINEGERRLRLLYNEERAKFNKGRRHNPTSLSARGHNNDYIVVTILVAVRGNHMIPTVKGSIDLKNALEKLESIPPSKIRSRVVLWTPQAENKTLSEKELESYPLLKL